MSSLGKIFNISNGRFTLGFCPEVGGVITHFGLLKETGQRIDLFRAHPEGIPIDPLLSASFPLTPYSNRIGNCLLEFEGKKYYVGPPSGGEPHSNHGTGWHSAWELESITENEATLRVQVLKSEEQPYSYIAYQTFSLTDKGLIITMKIENIGEETMPFGMGHHPYFPRTDKTTLTANLPRVWLSENMLPDRLVDVPKRWQFADGISFDPKNFEAIHGGNGTALIDHCFEWEDGIAEIYWPESETRLRISADPSLFRHFIVYAPSDGNFFCAEAVTNATDGFNLLARGNKNTGAVLLNPKQSFSGKMRFTLE